MTTLDSILLQLSEEQVTADAIAQRLNQPGVVVAAFLCDLEKLGHAVSSPLGNPEVGRKLALWRITEKGKTRSATLAS